MMSALSLLPIGYIMTLQVVHMNILTTAGAHTWSLTGSTNGSLNVNTPPGGSFSVPSAGPFAMDVRIVLTSASQVVSVQIDGGDVPTDGLVHSQLDKNPIINRMTPMQGLAQGECCCTTPCYPCCSYTVAVCRSTRAPTTC